MWGKFTDSAKKAAGQTSTFLHDGATLATTQAQGMRQGFTLPGECNKAANILSAFLADPDHPHSALNAVPKAVLLNAKGLAVFTVVKAGFIFSGRGGSGLVVARLPDGSWSAPSLIMTGGLGWGLQVGADITDFVIVLNSDEAVKAFSMGGNVTLGGNISASAGPIGTGASVQSAIASAAMMFSYSKSKGLFAGVSLEGTVLIERKDANKEFYGSPVPAKDILSGRVPPPEIASRMYEVIEAAEGIDELAAGVPQESYLPPGTHASTVPAGYAVGGRPMGGPPVPPKTGAASGQMVFDAEEHELRK